MLLLDWEKALDKVTREGFKSTLQRMNVHPKIRRVVEDINRNPTYMVETDGKTSEWYKHATGIRQGCPLSPYLFLVFMTVMFHDLHHEDTQNLIQNRIQGTNYDEVLCADDTICVSTSTSAINFLLASIEREGVKYGLRLNENKCEVIYNSNKANVHFRDGTTVPRKDGVKYLGCNLNATGAVGKETNTRIETCMIVLNRLNLFWRHSSCPPRFKLQVLDAVIRAKLMYVLESAQLDEVQLRKLDTFQLKGLRKILRMQTTYKYKTNTNEKVREEDNRAIREGGGTNRIRQYSTVYTEAKAEMFRRLRNG